MAPFDTTAYLSRIGLDGVPRSPAGLAALQSAQIRAIPFEAIDAFVGRVPRLEPAAVWDKLVAGRRGGYCFELNMLLGEALAAFGFAPRAIMARVGGADEGGGTRSHMAWIVRAGGRRLLLDAGFGGPGPLAPIDLDLGGHQRRPNGTYRLRRDEDTHEHVVERRGKGAWTRLFSFDETRVTDADIAAANFLCARWEYMPFARHLMLAGYRGDTRISVCDRTVTERGPDRDRTFHITDTGTLSATLAELGLNLPAGDVAEIWRRLSDAPAVAV